MKKSKNFLSLFFGKWFNTKDIVIEKRAVFVIFLVIFAGISYVYVNYFQLDTRANVLCPFPESPAKIHGQMVLTPTSEEGIFDCSGKDIIIASDGEVVVERYVNGDGSITGDYGAEILFRNLTIEAGGKFNADGQGYRTGETDGSIGNAIASTDNNDNTGGSGGGYGGAGGEGVSDGIHPPGEPGNSYGVSQNPNSFGGAGATSGTGAFGGNGGGSIKVTVSEALNLNGIISTNGIEGGVSLDGLSSGGGGAGGSIWIEARNFTGTGQVLSKGAGVAEASFQGGGGGGGRVQMFCNLTNNFTGIVNANGGVTNNSQDGGTGTILGPTCRPNVPTILKQYKLNLTTEVPVGGATAEASFYLTTNLSDPDSYDLLSLEVEVKPLGTAFANQVTHSQVSGFANPQACTGTANTCGRINVTGLARSTQYHWQARVRDNKGGISAWVSYGENTETEVDILLSGQASTIALIEGNNQNGIVNTNLAISFKTKVTDSNGFPIPGFTVSWSVPNGANGGALLGAVYTETNINGEATNTYKLGKQSGTNNNVIRVTGSGLNGSPVDYTASGNPDILNYFILSAPDVSLVDTDFNVLIKAYDQFNNIKSDLANTVNLSAVDPLNTSNARSGALTPNQVVFEISDGGQKTIALSYNTAESIKVKATLGLAVGFSNTVAVVTVLGNCPDVDGIVDTNQTWTATIVNNGIFDCTGLTIRVMSNATLTLRSYDSGDSNYTNDFGVSVLADALVIDPSSIVSANGLGYSSGRGPGTAGQNGGSHGGFGAAYNVTAVAPYGSVYKPITFGSSGGSSGSAGGGAIHLIMSSVNNSGLITSNGNGISDNDRGAGAGGSVWIDADSISGNGSITVNGGSRTGGYARGGGAGGRISLFYSSNSYTGTIQAFGGYSITGSYGGPGTIYLEDSTQHIQNKGILKINNNGNNGYQAGLVEGSYDFSIIELKNYGHLTFLGNNSELIVNLSSQFVGDTTKSVLLFNGTFNYLGGADLTLSGIELSINGKLEGVSNVIIGDTLPGVLSLRAYTWFYNQLNQNSFNDIDINSNGIMNLYSFENWDSNWTNDYGLTLNANSIINDGTINSNGFGYTGSRGPGTGGQNGASHGGFGVPFNGSLTNPYGSVYEPITFGSGGGNGGSSGGGALRLVVANTLTNNGNIVSNGLNTSNNDVGTGAGGSIWIDTNILAGIGSIQTNGGSRSGGYARGGGSGGRIAVYYSDLTYSGTFQSYGGLSTTGGYGGPGTIYLEDRTLDPERGGQLYIDNNNHNSYEAGLIQGSYQFKKIYATRYGHLVVLGNQSVLVLTSGSGIIGDSTISNIIVNGTIFTPLNLEISGYTLGIKGNKVGMNNIDIGLNGQRGGLTIYENTWAHNLFVDHFSFGNVEVGPNSQFNLVYGSVGTNYGRSVLVEFDELIINASGVASFQSYDNGDGNYTNDYGVEISAIRLENNGTITSTGLGYGGSRGLGTGYQNGGSYGGYGAVYGGGIGIAPYGDVYDPLSLGSGGGNYGSAGGGAMKISISGELLNNGTISSDGAYINGGNNDKGAGSGGSIIIDTTNLSGNGTVSVNGGPRGGEWGYARGGGGGGRMAVYYTNSTYGGAFTAYGGYGTDGLYGGPGTIYIEDRSVNEIKVGELFIDNNNHNFYEAGVVEGAYRFNKIHVTRYGHVSFVGNNGTLEITSGSGIIGDATIPNITIYGTITTPSYMQIDGCTLGIKGTKVGMDNIDIGLNGQRGGVTIYENTWAHNLFENHFTFGDVEIGPNSNLDLRYGSVGTNYGRSALVEFNELVVNATGSATFQSYDNGDGDFTNDYGVEISAGRIENSGTISSTGLGYSGNRGLGTGYQNGGSYGGYGAVYGGGSPITPYGDVYIPISLGSGGGNGGSNGGGALKFMISNELVNNGTISSDGAYINGGNNDKGAGSGGSIIIDTVNLSGNGTVSVNGGPRGGEWGYARGGGAGGRMAVYYTNTTYGGAFNAYGGYGTDGLYGGPGTVYIEDKTSDVSRYGRLLVNNNNHNFYSAGLPSNDYSFKSIGLSGYGNLSVLGQNSILRLSSNDGLIGDATKPTLIIEGTFMFEASEHILSLNGISLRINGDIQGVNDFVIGTTLNGGLILNAYTWKFNSEISYTFGDIHVGSLGTIYLNSYNNGNGNWADDYGIKLFVDNILIDQGGLITSTGTGYTGSQGLGTGSQNGASYGGYGVAYFGPSVATYGNIYEPFDFGSGGGNGGSAGGGAMKLIVSGELMNNGTISCDGDYINGGNNDRGAGSGGSLWIDTGSFGGLGLVSAKGGSRGGEWGYARGGGGGGRIAVYFTDSTYTGSMETFGGLSITDGYGGPGTIFTKDKDEPYGSLGIANNNHVGQTQDFVAGDYYFKNFIVGNNIYFNALGNTDLNKGVVFKMSGNFSLGTGSRIDGVGQGFLSDQGPGAGESGVNLSGGGGGANGGAGGAGQSDGSVQAQGGQSYNTENQMQPYMLGSGGGHSGAGALGGNGGGAVAINARYGHIDLFGTVDVSGTNGKISSPGGGGGAGGSILLIGSSCNITGSLLAEGGDGGDNNYDGGGGGGGRASILLTSPLINCDITNATVSVALGSSSEGFLGQVGTYVGVSTLPQIELNSQNKVGGELIPVGGIISDNQLKFIVQISDPGANQNDPKDLVADFEIIEKDENFINAMAPLGNPSSAMNAVGKDNKTFNPQNQNGMVAGLTVISTPIQTLVNGDPLEVTVQITEGLTGGQGYKWRARVRDVTLGISSAWVEYGNNGSEADFQISDVAGFEVTIPVTEIETGVFLPISVRAFDSSNITAINYDGTITYSYQPTTNPGPSLPSDYTFGIEDLGIHSSNNELMFFVPGVYTITVTDSLNPGLIGIFAEITVIAAPTPIPTNTPIVTITLAPTTNPSITPTEGPTDNTMTATPTVTNTPVSENCSENPNQAICQLDVEITNVVVTVNDTELTAKICWDTNILIIGSVAYGESLLSSSTDLETVYATSHCANLADLKADTGYGFKITATSEVGRNDTYDDTFKVGKASTPENPVACIVVNRYSFNANAQLLLNYQTAYSATCNVNYTYLGDMTSYFKDIETESMIYHLSKMNLSRLLGDKDIAYAIKCQISGDTTETNSVNSCELNGSIPRGKIGVYLPETGDTLPSFVTETMNVIEKVLPVVTIPLLAGTMSNLLFGFFWLKLKRKNQAWGLVYDGVDRKPVAFAVVRLFDSLSGKLLKEEVSSIDGKYNFLVGAGKYRLVAEHSLYNALERELTITTKSGEVVEEMALTKRDVKLTVRPHGLWKKIKLFFVKNNDYIVLCGFLISLIASILSSSWYNYTILALYLVQEILLLLSKGIQWARVLDLGTGEAMPGVFVRLYHPEQKRQLEVTLTDKQGRYKFITEDGKWLATAYQEGYQMALSLNEEQGAGQKLIWINIKGGVTKDDIKLTRVS